MLDDMIDNFRKEIQQKMIDFQRQVEMICMEIPAKYILESAMSGALKRLLESQTYKSEKHIWDQLNHMSCQIQEIKNRLNNINEAIPKDLRGM